MPLSQPILICGAGVGGLALAQGLLKAGIPFRVFERDAALNVRPQGYRFRIIDPAGVDALEQVLPSDVFARVKATGAIISPNGSVRLNALTGERLTAYMGGRRDGGEVLSLDRRVLRSVLFQGLEEYVEFGKEFSSYRTTPSGGVVVRFADGCELPGALLVGADGVQSRVRKQFLPERGVLDTEARLFFGKTIFTPDLVAKFHEEGLKGLCLIQEYLPAQEEDALLSLLLEPIHFRESEFKPHTANSVDLPPDYVYWGLVWRKDRLCKVNKNYPPEIDDKALLSLSSAEAAALCQRLTAHWHPSFHALFSLQEHSQTSILRVCTALPGLPAWEPSSHVTLLGDAAHAMSPTAAAGATTAIRDAATLTQVLAEMLQAETGKRNVGKVSADSIGRYEALMKAYADEALEKSGVGGKKMFGMRPFRELKPITDL